MQMPLTPWLCPKKVLRIIEQEFVIGRGRNAFERGIYSCDNTKDLNASHSPSHHFPLFSVRLCVRPPVSVFCVLTFNLKLEEN